MEVNKVDDMVTDMEVDMVVDMVAWRRWTWWPTILTIFYNFDQISQS